MNVLHLSTGDSHGAFYGAYRTHENLLKCNHKSTMCVLEKTSVDDNVIQISSVKKRNLLGFVNKIARRLLIREDNKKNRFYFFYHTTCSVNQIKKKYREKPDLIIVYFVANFLSDNDILALQQFYQCPVAFYLMDAAMVTGGCHYPWECEGYTKSCDSCPAMKYPHLIPVPHYVLNTRISLYKKLNCTFLSASKWLDHKCRLSAIKPKHGITKALIGIDEKKFKPRVKDFAEKVLNIEIPSNRVTFLLGAQSLSDPRKGFVLLIGAIKKISQSHPKLLDRITLLTVGTKPEGFFPKNVKHLNIGFISSKDKYPLLYNLVDAFICPSIEDAGPMMINESLMSGTPVIAFEMGVAEDLIIDGETGYIAREMTSECLSQTIITFLKNDEHRMNAMKEKSRRIAMEKCSSQSQIDSIEAILPSLIS